MQGFKIANNTFFSTCQTHAENLKGPGHYKFLLSRYLLLLLFIVESTTHSNLEIVVTHMKSPKGFDQDFF